MSTRRGEYWFGRTEATLSINHVGDKPEQHVVIPVGESTEVRIGAGPPKDIFWVRRDVAWVPTMTNGPGQIKYLQLTNISDRDIILGHEASLALWMASDMIPRSPGYASIGSRWYTE